MENTITTTSTEELQKQIDALRSGLTGDMFADMETLDKIHNLEMQVKGVRPMDSYVECVGCGS